MNTQSIEPSKYYTPREWLNVSTLTATARCPRKAFYQSGCELAPPRESPALKYGESIHRALPELLTGDRKEALGRSINAFNKVWDEKLKDEKRNAFRALHLLEEFQRTHTGPLAPYELVHPRDIPGLSESAITLSDAVSEYELAFAIDIGLSVPLVGRIDGLCRHRVTGRLSILEYKTTSSLYNYFDAFKFSPQVLLYNVGINASYPQLNIDTTVVDAILVSKTQVGTLSHVAYVEEHHRQEALQWAQFFGGLYLDCEKRGEFPKWFTGCHPYSMFGSHGYLCDYWTLCQPKHWEQNVSLFVKREDKRYELKQVKDATDARDSIPTN